MSKQNKSNLNFFKSVFILGGTSEIAQEICLNLVQKGTKRIHFVSRKTSKINLLGVLEELDNELASIGGKIYLAKDSRQTSEMFKKTYLSYQKWKTTKDEMDPENLFQSDLSKRLRM